jgi:hypothetical protein
VARAGFGVLVLALSTYATREFERLGLLDGLAEHSTEPMELIWRGGRMGERSAAHPVLAFTGRACRRACT